MRSHRFAWFGLGLVGVVSAGCGSSKDAPSVGSGEVGIQWDAPVELCSVPSQADTLMDAQRNKVMFTLWPAERSGLSADALRDSPLSGGVLRTGPLEDDRAELRQSAMTSELTDWRSRVFENGKLWAASIEHQLGNDLGTLQEDLHVFREASDTRPVVWGSNTDMTIGYKAPGAEKTIPLRPCGASALDPSQTDETYALEAAPIFQSNPPMVLLRQVAIGSNGQTTRIERMEVRRWSPFLEHYSAGGHWVFTTANSGFWNLRIDFTRDPQLYQSLFSNPQTAPDEAVIESMETLNGRWTTNTINPRTQVRSQTQHQGYPNWRRIDPESLSAQINGICPNPDPTVTPTLQIIGDPARYLFYLASCPGNGPLGDDVRFIIPVLMPTDLDYLGRWYGIDQLETVSVEGTEGLALPFESIIAQFANVDGTMVMRIVDLGGAERARYEGPGQAPRIAAPKQETITKQDGDIAISMDYLLGPAARLAVTRLELKIGDQTHRVQSWDRLVVEPATSGASEATLRAQIDDLEIVLRFDADTPDAPVSLSGAGLGERELR